MKLRLISSLDNNNKIFYSIEIGDLEGCWILMVSGDSLENMSEEFKTLLRSHKARKRGSKHFLKLVKQEYI